jgi:hypothetical protein
VRSERHARERGGIVVSSLVSFVYVRLRSLASGLMRRCRSRTLTLFGELLSRLLKSGRLAVRSQALGRLVIWLADARLMGVEVLAAPAPVAQPTAAV